MTTTSLKRNTHMRATPVHVGGDVRPLVKKHRDVKSHSEQTLRTFAKISDPSNAQLFTAEAACKAFAHIKI